MTDRSTDSDDWREARRSGIGVIAVSALVGAAIWFGVFHFTPPLAGMEDISARMIVALKCWCMAVLFCFAPGVEAVAHERLQSAAFDPLAGHETRRLRVNLRYLQNTLEQIVQFSAALFGLAYYCADGAAMRVVVATTVVWVLARLAFWIGYHVSAAMRGAGMIGMMISLVALLYVGARIGADAAGPWGAVAVVGAFLAIEAVLFRTTRAAA